MDNPSIQNETSDAGLAVGKWLAGGLAFFTTLFTLIGATGGALERILRNEPGEATFYFALMGVGIASGVVLAAVPDEPVGRKEVTLVSVGVLAIASAFVLPSISLGGKEAAAYLTWRFVGLVLFGALFAAFLALFVRKKPYFWMLPSSNWSGGWLFGAIGLGVLALFLVPTWGAAIALGGALALVIAIQHILRNHEPHLRGLVVAGGLVVFFIGMAGLFQLAVESTSAKDRPSVTAKFTSAEDSVFIEATALASGLRSDEHVLFLIEGLSLDEPLARHVAGLARAGSLVEKVAGSDYTQTIYLSRTGPDENGDVDLSVLAPVSVGLYERMRVSAYLIQNDDTDLSAGEEQARREDDAEQRRADAYNERHDVYGFDSTEEARRVRYDEEHGAESDPEEAERRVSYAHQRYRERVDDEEMTRRMTYASARKLRDKELETMGAAKALEDIRCSPTLQDRGCIELLVPERPNRPDIAASWKSGGRSILNVSVRLASASADDVVKVGVFGRRAFEAGFTNVLYEAALAAGFLGVIDHTIDVVPPEGIVEICVFGEAVHAAGTSPPGQPHSTESGCLAGDSSVAAIKLAVPASASLP